MIDSAVVIGCAVVDKAEQRMEPEGAPVD